MDGLKNVYSEGILYAKERYYPTTIAHFVYIIIYFIITFYVTDYFLNFKLFKWIYMGTIIVILITLYNKGENNKYLDRKDKKKVAMEVFNLATL